MTRIVLGFSLILLLPALSHAQASPSPSTGGGPVTDSPSPVTGEPGKGVVLTTADNRLSMNIRGRVQARSTLRDSAGEMSQVTQIKTVRLYVQGHVLWSDLKYVIQLAAGAGDFEEGSSSPIFDAYIEHTHLRDLNLKVGQYFVPFDRARTVREFALQFVDRPVLIPEMTLDRDVGITATSSDLFGLGGRLFYALGVFGGDGRNRTTAAEPGLLYVARLAVTPFGSFDDNSEGDLSRKPEPRLMVGVAAAYNQNTDRQRSTSGARLTLGGFDYVHAATDLVFKYAGLSVMAEALYLNATHAAHTGVDTNGAAITERSRSAWGYLTQVGMMLTERVEIAGRWAHQGVIGKTDTRHQALLDTQAHEATFGANYYLNQHYFKFQLDAGLRWGQWSNPKEYVARLQLDASF